MIHLDVYRMFVPVPCLIVQLLWSASSLTADGEDAVGSA
jgi:hypothetical protein